VLSSRLDLILTDDPSSSATNLLVRSVGGGQLGFYATPHWHRKLKAKFPQSLTGAPFILPLIGSSQRKSLELEFSRLGVKPSVRVEIDDSALMKSLGATGLGVIAAPCFLAQEIFNKYGLRLIGASRATESYFAICHHHHQQHPGTLLILDAVSAGRGITPKRKKMIRTRNWTSRSDSRT
jgi:LysR family transcriptional regulator, transcriptional activator of nhaA